MGPRERRTLIEAARGALLLEQGTDMRVCVSQVCVLFQVKTRLGVRYPRDYCTGRRPTGTLPSVAAAPLTLTY